MSASNSPFLRLPRELRDEIYHYALLEQAGYRYKAASGRLTTFHDTPVNLSLSYTCKKIYAETRGLALHTNRITFTPQRDSSSSPGTNGISISRRLNDVQNRYYEALRIMSSWMAEYVTPEHINKLLHLHPADEQAILLRDLNDEQRLERLKKGGLFSSPRGIGTLNTIRDFVRLLSEHDAFYPSTAKEYDAGLRDGQIPPYIPVQLAAIRSSDGTYNDTKHCPHYIPGSQQELLERIIEPWRIMEETEIARLEFLLPQKSWLDYSDSDSDTDSEGDVDGFELPVPIEHKHHFSATACAIQFLQKLPKDTLRHIRMISIIEDRSSLSDHASHSHGLIPVCKENPQLRVETQVDIWDVFFWQCWIKPFKRISAYVLRSCTANYLREALLLRTRGMPAGQYTLKLRGRTLEMELHVWDCLKTMAKVQDAAVELCRRHPERERPEILRNTQAADFHKLVKEILKGGTVVRLDSYVGEPWDLDQAVRDLERSPQDLEQWEKLIDLSQYEQEEEFDALSRKFTYIDQ